MTTELQPDIEAVTIDRIERGLVVLAYMMVLDGPVYAPLFERLAWELQCARAENPKGVRRDDERQPAPRR
jgi:hypothetical protein